MFNYNEVEFKELILTEEDGTVFFIAMGLRPDNEFSGAYRLHRVSLIPFKDRVQLQGLHMQYNPRSYGKGMTDKTFCSIIGGTKAIEKYKHVYKAYTLLSGYMNLLEQLGLTDPIRLSAWKGFHEFIKPMNLTALILKDTFEPLPTGVLNAAAQTKCGFKPSNYLALRYELYPKTDIIDVGDILNVFEDMLSPAGESYEVATKSPFDTADIFVVAAEFHKLVESYSWRVFQEPIYGLDHKYSPARFVRDLYRLTAGFAGREYLNLSGLDNLSDWRDFLDILFGANPYELAESRLKESNVLFLKHHSDDACYEPINDGSEPATYERRWNAKAPPPYSIYPIHLLGLKYRGYLKSKGLTPADILLSLNEGFVFPTGETISPRQCGADLTQEEFSFWIDDRDARILAILWNNVPQEDLPGLEGNPIETLWDILHNGCVKIYHFSVEKMVYDGDPFVLRHKTHLCRLVISFGEPDENQDLDRFLEFSEPVSVFRTSHDPRVMSFYHVGDRYRLELRVNSRFFDYYLVEKNLTYARY